MSQKRLTQETIDYAKSVNVYDMALALGIPLERVGRSYFTHCFVHDEKTPSLSIEPSRNRFTCFGRCEDTKGSGAIAFYQFYKWRKKDNANFIEAVIEVCHLMGHPVTYEDGTTIESDRPVRPQIVISEREDSPLAEYQLLTAVYASLIEKLPLKKSHFDHLTKERKIDTAVVGMRQYRSFPVRPYMVASELLNEFQTLEGIPGFYESVKRDESDTYWNMSGINGILIPVRNEYGAIHGIQIRVESPKLVPSIFATEGHAIQATVTEKDVLTIHYKKRLVYSAKVTGSEKVPIKIAGQDIGHVTLKRKNKYIWLSSTGRRKGTKAVPTYHVAYPPSGFPDGSTIDCSTVGVTEGPIKGDIASEYMGIPFVCIPGLTQWHLAVEGVKRLNAKKVILAIDGDALKEPVQDNKEEEKEEVGKVIRALIKEFASEGISIDIAMWDISSSAKGIDDLYTLGLKPKIFPVFEAS